MCSRARVNSLALVAGVLLLAAAGCGEEERTTIPAVVSSVEPACVVDNESATLTIRGSMPVRPVVSLGGGGRSTLETGYRAFLGDAGGVELAEVRWVDAATITATVPEGVTPGVYPLTVVSPFGEASAPGGPVQVAADVCRAVGSSLVVTAEATPGLVRVGGQVILVVTVQNTGDQAATGVSTAIAAPPGFDVFTSPQDPVTIAAGQSRTFTWTFTAVQGAGNGRFSVTAAGVDAGTGEPVSSADAESNLVAATYALSGSVASLEGSGLSVSLNGGVPQALAANGPFSLGELPSGTAFELTIAQQPVNPTQTCTVSGGAGTVGTGPITSIVVNCAVNTFTIGGTVTGLVGSGLVLREATSDQTVAVNSAGTFAFPAPVRSGRPYSVSVPTQPTNPAQTCTVANGSSTVGSSNVTSVSVTCTTNPVTLGVTVDGAGSGSVLCNGAPCQSNYTYGTTVAITPQPATGSTFAGWAGDCTGTGPCALTMTTSRTVRATFDLQQVALTVATAGDGAGQLRCNGVACQPAYPFGSVIAVTALPEAGSAFTGWSGDCTGGAVCSVTMTAPRNVTGTFSLQSMTLSLTAAGTGTGSLSCNNAPCQATYPFGTVVSITAAPGAGSNFSGWSGSCSAVSGPCTVTMDANRSVTATFTLQQVPLTTATIGNGTGSLLCNGALCLASYPWETTVTITPVPSETSQFSSWSGACSGAGGCAVTLQAAQSVTAEFTLRVFTLDLQISGAGTVLCNGGNCQPTYTYSTAPITLTPVDMGGVFQGWGGECNGRSPCTLVMTANHTVTATFIP